MAGLDARACALLADVEPRELHFAGAAGEHFLERDLDGRLEVVATRRSAASAATSPAAGNAAAEDVAEHREDVVDVHRPEVVPGRLAKPRMPVLVVAGAALRVGEHLVGAGALLEALLRLGVAGVVVWMVLEREPSVRGLDLVAARGASDAEDLVVAAFGGHRVSSVGTALRIRPGWEGGPGCGRGRASSRNPVRAGLGRFRGTAQDTAFATGLSSSLSSATITSVVSIRPATLAALSSAVRETSAGSMMPALTRSQ